MRQRLVAVLSAAALALPSAEVAAAATAPVAAPPKKKVTTYTRTVSGSIVPCDRWGDLQVVIVVRVTRTTVGKKTTVKRRMIDVRVPVYPDHSHRSVFINEQAIPYLVQEALAAQSADIQLVSGATDTSYSFAESLQAAIQQALTLK